MRPNQLRNLLARNRGKGNVRAESGADGNTIWLYDVIVSSEDDAAWLGGYSAEGFARTLAGMTGPVKLRINSPGGDVFAGIAMAQAIRDYPDGVDVQIDGLAASIASIIAIAGRTVTAAPGSFMMIHKAWTIMFGNADDLMREAALLEKVDQTLASRYSARAGEGTDWLSAMASETWFTADEAVAAGLVDHVVAEQQAVNARWDLSAYAAPPALSIADIAISSNPHAEMSPMLSARQGALYAGIEAIAEEFGAFDQTISADGAHYIPANPFAGSGIKCANCSLYAGGRSCEVVSGDIDPEAICKLWIIRQDLIGAPENGQAAEIAARQRRLAVELRSRAA